MCLQTVNLTKTGKKNKVVSKGGRFLGYKSFYMDELYNNDEVISYKMNPLSQMHRIPKIGEWIEATNVIIEGPEENKNYTSGFHIFLDLEDAEQYQEPYTVYLVEFEDIVAIGKQSNTDNNITVVAKKMKLLSKISSDVR